MSDPVPCPWCGTPMEPRIQGRLGLFRVYDVGEDCAGHVAVLLCPVKACGAVSPFGLGPTKAEAVQAAEDKARRLATKQAPPAGEVADAGPS